jgi:hypothetical protein
MADPAPNECRLDEQGRVTLHRYAEARRYGLTMVEARLFADSGIDVSELRRLKRKGCPPRLAAEILL